MYDIIVLQKATVPAVDNQHIQIFYNKTHFLYLLSYTNFRKGHPVLLQKQVQYMLGLFDKTCNNSV